MHMIRKWTFKKYVHWGGEGGGGGPYSPVFPIDFNFLLILMIFNSVLSMNGEPTQDRNVDYVKNICNLLWLAEYQCKGVVKSNMSNLYSGVSFGQFLTFQ